MELIDKAAVVAEIDRLQDSTMDEYHNFETSYKEGMFDGLSLIENYIDTLEVKEVDCEREIGIYTTKELLKKRCHSTSVFHLGQTDINSIAKHFFELGLNARKEK